MKKQPLFEKQFDTWDEWLEYVDLALTEKGYKKFVNISILGNHNFEYCKNFYNDDSEEPKYLIRIKFYDFREFSGFNDEGENRIGIQFSCLLNDSGRIDLDVSKDISLKMFEDMSEIFFQSMKQFLN